MEVLEASFTTTSLATEGELAANPINGSANDQTYFVKPYEDPDSRFRIEEAKILIKSIYRRRLDVNKKIAERRSDREEVLSRLKILHEKEKILKYDMVWRKKPQEHLQLALDKLSFANSAYQDREINSCFVADDINYRNLNFKMLHGSKNLAAEKKILREIKASEKGKIVSLWSSLKEIDKSIYRLRYPPCYPSHDSAGGDKQMLKEMKQLEIAREKAVANASMKGKIWNSLGTKKALQEEFKIKDKELEDIKKEHLLLKPNIKKADKELQRVQKDIISLQLQLTHLRRRMEEAYQHIVLLQKE
ncbi:proton pump-interactor [Salix suchowensis]|nr:proton pump-interactor [Salix suchowensis]